jgi:hypothetical protein
MIGPPASPARTRSIWSRAWRFLQAFDEALHTTETDRLAARIGSLEQQLKRLTAEDANHLGHTETSHD